MKSLEYHRMSDQQFIERINTCTLVVSDFTHEAHLRLAWINIRKYGIDEAIRITQDQIKNYVTHLGVGDKFNLTLTIASVLVVHHFMQKSSAITFPDFIIEYPQLKYRFKDLIRTHYSYDIFYLEKVKDKYHAPDLLPFSIG